MLHELGGSILNHNNISFEILYRFLCIYNQCIQFLRAAFLGVDTGAALVLDVIATLFTLFLFFSTATLCRKRLPPSFPTILYRCVVKPAGMEPSSTTPTSVIERLILACRLQLWSYQIACGGHGGRGRGYSQSCSCSHVGPRSNISIDYITQVFQTLSNQPDQSNVNNRQDEEANDWVWWGIRIWLCMVTRKLPNISRIASGNTSSTPHSSDKQVIAWGCFLRADSWNSQSHDIAWVIFSCIWMLISCWIPCSNTSIYFKRSDDSPSISIPNLCLSIHIGRRWLALATTRSMFQSFFNVFFVGCFVGAYVVVNVGQSELQLEGKLETEAGEWLMQMQTSMSITWNW